MKKKYEYSKGMLEKMRKVGKSYEECMEMDMTPKERNIFIVVDEWWKEFGYGPSIDDIMRNSGDKGRGNVSRVIKNLCELGALKRLPGKDRSVRPAYINFRNIE
jgi:SOS-response transcriptional repressor LexA